MHLEVHILLLLYINAGLGATYNESYFEPTQEDHRQRIKRSGNCPEVNIEANNGKTCQIYDYVVYPVTGYHYYVNDIPPGKCYPEGTTELMADLLPIRMGWYCRGSVTVKVHYCPSLPYFNYGSKRCSGDRENVYGSICNFSCNDGYTLDGPRSITCGTFYSKTSWSSSVPSCKKQDCPPLLYFNFGSKSCSGDRENVYGSTCNFSCNNGYTLDGPRSITCGTYNSKSDWSSRIPSCKVQQCPPLQNFTFGVKQCSGDKETVYGSTCNFCCHSGYILDGPQNITCGTVDSKPTWSGNAPSCIGRGLDSSHTSDKQVHGDY